MTQAQAQLALRDVPKSVVADFNRCRQSLRKVECTSVPVASTAEWSGKIEFDEVGNVVEGNWNGSRPEFVIERPFKQRFTGSTNHDYWGTQITAWGHEITVDSERPWIEVRVKAFGRKHMHERITGLASVEVTYPQAVDSGFTDTTVGRARSVSFYVVAPKELVALETLSPGDGSLPWGTAFRILGALALSICLFLLIRGLIRGIRRLGHGGPLPH